MNVHLIRHGEVENPHDVVYATLPGFGLSARGRDQAAAAGQRLAQRGLRLVVTSPLQRARETARLISRATGAGVVPDNRLVEWDLSTRWAGVPWEQLPELFPGELEAYLEDPRDLPFSPESLDDAGRRVAACVTDWSELETGELAFVSHQDPVHAGALFLSGIAVSDFHAAKPAHCSITTLRRDRSGWHIAGRWAPAD